MFFLTLIGNLVLVSLNNRTYTEWTLFEKQVQKFWSLLERCVSFFDHRKYLKLFSNFVRGILVSFLFLYLSAWKDSFVTIVFLFPGKNVDLKKKRVLGLFILSHVVCNVAWVLVTAWGIDLVRMAFGFLFK